MIKALWRNHSLTIVGLVLGGGMVALARWLWPNGGVDFDLVTLIGGVLLSLGIQGVLYANFRETAKPEDEC